MFQSRQTTLTRAAGCETIIVFHFFPFFVFVFVFFLFLFLCFFFMRLPFDSDLNCPYWFDSLPKFSRWSSVSSEKRTSSADRADEEEEEEENRRWTLHPSVTASGRNENGKKQDSNGSQLTWKRTVRLSLTKMSPALKSTSGCVLLSAQQLLQLLSSVRVRTCRVAPTNWPERTGRSG